MTVVDMSWPAIQARIKDLEARAKDKDRQRRLEARAQERERQQRHRDRIAYAVPNTPGEWTDLAACKGRGDLFYSAATEDLAKDICRGCPVQSACLDHALTHRELGVWGATTAQQRDLIRKQRQRRL